MYPTVRSFYMNESEVIYVPHSEVFYMDECEIIYK